MRNTSSKPKLGDAGVLTGIALTSSVIAILVSWKVAVLGLIFGGPQPILLGLLGLVAGQLGHRRSEAGQTGDWSLARTAQVLSVVALVLVAVALVLRVIAIEYAIESMYDFYQHPPWEAW